MTSSHAYLHSSHVACVSMYRSTNGRKLLITSTDGYCSMLCFDEGELGVETTIRMLLYQLQSASPT
jgi:hypothetical protein